jgi:hypothetical protein
MDEEKKWGKGLRFSGLGYVLVLTHIFLFFGNVSQILLAVLARLYAIALPLDFSLCISIIPAKAAAAIRFMNKGLGFQIWFSLLSLQQIPG